MRIITAIHDALEEARAARVGASEQEQSLFLAKVHLRERHLGRLRATLRTAVNARREQAVHPDRGARDALLGGMPKKRRQGKGLRSDDDDAMGAGEQTRAMAESLQRTRRMMAEQLERVAHVSSVVAEQGGLLSSTYDEHRGIGGTIRRAGASLTRLRAKDAVDAVLMGASTAFFFLTVLYVVWVRLPIFGLR
ncbi:unnamed protein product [Phaeothamnion confervicola]